MSLRADSARVRSRMLAAARARIDAGDLELPMNAVAREAGVGVGTMYRHFATRHSLLEALATGGLQELARQARAAAETPDISTGLSTLIRAALQLQLTDPALATVLASGEIEAPDTRGFRDELMSAFQQILARARAEGAIRPDLTADDLRRLTCGIRTAVTTGDPQDLDRYLEILMRGLRPDT